jgi:SPP1 family phage portal protein
MKQILDVIRQGASSVMTEREFLEKEIAAWKATEKRKWQIDGERYYNYDHDILKRKRKAIGKDGKLTEVKNLPNNRIIDNQYAKAVDQKTNYSLAKPFTVDTDNDEYAKHLRAIFNNKFRRTLKHVGRDSINGGLGWIHPYYGNSGKLKFKKFSPWEIIPFWKDADHTELDAFIRIYSVSAYEGKKEMKIEKVEYYHSKGINFYVLSRGELIDDVERPSRSHFSAKTSGKQIPLNWNRIPLVAFKYSDKEISLLKRVKGLQDGINDILSDFKNNMQEDTRNTILVLTNYDGTNLGEFRHNLSEYGVVKVQNINGSAGGLSTLTIEVNSENYKAILEILKKALIENAKALDAKDDRLGSNANQMNIQSMYSDLDLDANSMELEFSAAFEDLLWFINMDLSNNGKGDFSDEAVKIVFNRDIMINESKIIEDINNSSDMLSQETLLAKHPFVDDPKEEIKRIEAEKKKEQSEMDEYKNAFNKGGDVNEE